MAKKVTHNYFHPQAFLMYSNADSSAKLQKSKLTPKKNSATIQKISGNYQTTGVMSRIYNSKKSSSRSLIKENYFNLEPYKVSALIPELRFFKVQGDQYTPFYFPISAITDNAASMDEPSRLGASGIQSFSVNYEGTDPFTAPKYLTANLVLYVDNLENLFHKPEMGYARLADLFTISMPNLLVRSEKGGASINSTDMVRPIEIAATLGYTMINRDIFTQEEIDEIRDSNIALRMNVFNHTINVNQNGTATVDISYTARIDNAGRDKLFSVLDSPEDLLARADIRQLVKVEKSKAGDIDGKLRTKSALDRKRKTQLAKLSEVRQILEHLDKKKKIYSLKLNYLDLIRYASFGKQGVEERTSSDFVGPMPEGTDQKTSPVPTSDLLATEDQRLSKVLKDLDFGKREVYYVTFGDILESFMLKVRLNLEKTKELLQPSFYNSKTGEQFLNAEGLGDFLKKKPEEKENIRKVIDGALKKLTTFKVLLSDVEFKYSGKSKEKEEKTRINLADVPISLFTYQKFMYDSVMNTQRNTFVIPQFLESCIRRGGLLDMAFKEWSETGIAPNIISAAPDFTSSTFSGPQIRSFLSKKSSISPSQIPSPQKDFQSLNVDDECDYFVIYQSATQELSPDKSGKIEDDAARGIYHFEIGKNMGLLKDVSFSKIDVPFVQEQLMTNQVGMYDELKMVYKASVKMVGNNLFFPGSQVFIDPGTIGMGNPLDINSASYRLGLGGYYTVIGVSTAISNGQAETTIDCMYESHATGRDDKVESSPQPEKSGQIDTPEESSNDDTVPQPLPDLRVDPGSTPAAYYQELTQVRDSDGKLILDEQMAKIISDDFRTTPSQRPQKIKGVVSRQVGDSGYTVIYHLINGKSVKVSETSKGAEVVFVQNSKSFTTGID